MTWCCCVTPCRPASRPTERTPDAPASARGDHPDPGDDPASVRGRLQHDGARITFHRLADGQQHLALGLGTRVATDTAPGLPLVRSHSECLTGDVLGSERCDCGPQLREAVERIAAVGGYLLYLRQEGRGIGLYAKLDAYRLQDAGLDTYEANVALGYPADRRDYTVAAQMLRALGVSRVALLTNNPNKAVQLEQLNIEVVRRVPTATHLSPANAAYLTAKARRAAHTLNLENAAAAPGLDCILGRRSG